MGFDHINDRAFIRYGHNIDVNDIKCLKSQILGNRSLFIGVSNNLNCENMEFHYAVLNKVPVKVLFNKTTDFNGGFIVTLYPIDVDEFNLALSLINNTEHPFLKELYRHE